MPERRRAPARRAPSARRPPSAPSIVASGPARPSHHCGSGVLKRSSTLRKRSLIALLQGLVEQDARLGSVVVGEHDQRASARPRSPARATRLTVVRRRRTTRRTSRGPFWASSTIPASATREQRHPRRDGRADTSTGSRPSRAAPARWRSARRLPQEGSSSSATSTPADARRRAASHSAACALAGRAGRAVDRRRASRRPRAGSSRSPRHPTPRQAGFTERAPSPSPEERRRGSRDGTPRPETVTKGSRCGAHRKHCPSPR